MQQASLRPRFLWAFTFGFLGAKFHDDVRACCLPEIVVLLGTFKLFGILQHVSK